MRLQVQAAAHEHTPNCAALHLLRGTTALHGVGDVQSLQEQSTDRIDGVLRMRIYMACLDKTAQKTYALVGSTSIVCGTY